MAIEALRIDEDDAAFDLLPELERSFAVRFEDDELRQVRTVGDLHVLVMRRTDYAGGDRCGTSHAFYALRRAATSMGLPAKAHPDVGLHHLALSPKILRERLERTTGLEMPALTVGAVGSVGCAAALVTAPVLMWSIGWWMLLLSLFAAKFALMLDRGTWSGDWRSLGELSRAAAALSHAQLARHGAIHSPRSAWLTIIRLIAPYTRQSDSEIGPETRLFA